MIGKICKHEKLYKTRNFDYCISCGSLYVNSSFSIKSRKYYYLVDHSPITTFEIMRRSANLPVENTNQIYLKSRSEIIRDLRIYFEKLLYSSQVFYLAIHYLDLVSIYFKEKFDLVALCCLSLAAKFDESDLNDLVLYEMEKDYTLYDLKKYEVACLNLLKFKLNQLTPYHFLSFFIAHGFVFSDDIVSDKILSKSQSEKDNNSKFNQEFLERLSDKVYYNAKEILFHFLDDLQYLQFIPLHIACSCISISREVNKIFDLWPLNMEKVYFIKFDEFSDCFFTIQKAISTKKIPNSEISKYFSVANQTNFNNLRSPFEKRNSLHVHYEGAKIISSIEDNESLNNLKNNLVNQHENEIKQVEEVKFIRDTKKKQTVMNKGEIKIERVREETCFENKLIRELDNKLKINEKSNEITKTNTPNNIFNIGNNFQQKIQIPEMRSLLKK